MSKEIDIEEAVKTLKELQRNIDTAISLMRYGDMYNLYTSHEEYTKIAKYKRYDFRIGRFGIKIL